MTTQPSQEPKLPRYTTDPGADTSSQDYMNDHSTPNGVVSDELREQISNLMADLMVQSQLIRLSAIKSMMKQGRDYITAHNIRLDIIMQLITQQTTAARIDELSRLSSATFLRTVHTTITDSNGGVYSDDERTYISKYEVQERIAQLKKGQV